MKIYKATALALLLSTSAASACEVQKIINVEFGYMRAKPDLRAAPLWKLGNGVAVVWCGRTSTDARGIVWNWVGTMWKEEQWAHEGWISSRIVERDVPTITKKPETPGYDPTTGGYDCYDGKHDDCTAEWSRDHAPARIAE